MLHFLNRKIHKLRCIIRCRPFHTGREIFLQLSHFIAHQFGRRHRVTRIGQHHRHTYRRFAVQIGAAAVTLRTQFDLGNVAQIHIGAVAVAGQNNIAELFRCRQLAFCGNGGGNRLPFGRRQRAQRTGGNLRILRSNGASNIGKRQVITLQLLRINPNTHRPLGSKHLHRAYAFQALQVGNDIALGIIGHIRHADIIRRQHHHHQEVRLRFGYRHPVLLHRRRQRRQNLGQLVLHIHLRHILVGAGRKGQRHAARTAGIGRRLGVIQPLNAVHIPFNHSQHAVFHHLRRRTRISRRQGNSRCGHRRILRDRQFADTQQPRQNNENRDHPSKNRAIDKEFSHVVPSLWFFS